MQILNQNMISKKNMYCSVLGIKLRIVSKNMAKMNAV